MKKRLLILLFFVFLYLPIFSLSALEINLSKSQYNPGETLQAQITGNFISLNSENILIYKNGIQHSNPVISDLTKQNGIYYFYAILPYEEGNYSLKIQGAKYLLNDRIKNDDIVNPFTIISSNNSYLSITPGFIVTSKDFSINVKSLKGDSQVLLNFGSQSENLTISSDNSESIPLSIENYSDSVQINDYNIPVFILNKSGIVIPNYNSDLIFVPSNINATITTNDLYLFNILIKNIGSKNLSNINLSSDLNVLLTPSTIPVLNSGDSVNINATILIAASQTNISGIINASYDGNEAMLPVNFLITNNQSQVNLTGTSDETVSCSRIGTVCQSNQNCNGTTTASLDGPCCIGQCVIIPVSSNSSIFWGILLVAILIGIIWYGYYYLKQKQKPKSSDEMLKERNDKFKQRMSNSGKEVSGSLGKV